MQSGSVGHRVYCQLLVAQTMCCEQYQTLVSSDSIIHCWCGKALLYHYDRQICTSCRRCQSLNESLAIALACRSEQNTTTAHNVNVSNKQTKHSHHYILNVLHNTSTELYRDHYIHNDHSLSKYQCNWLPEKTRLWSDLLHVEWDVEFWPLNLNVKSRPQEIFLQLSINVCISKRIYAVIYLLQLHNKG